MVLTNGARLSTEQSREISSVKRDYYGLSSYANFFLRPQDAKILAKGNGKKLHEIYRDVQSDPRIYAALTQRFGAAIGREIVVEAASDRRIDKKAADEVRLQIKNLGRRSTERSNKAAVYSFGGFENATLTFLDARFIGYSVVEIDWAVEGDRVVARQLWSRESSRFTFDIADGGWELRLLTLESPLNGIALPPKKFLLTCVNSHDDSPYGDGLANKLFWLSWLKRQIQKWWAIFCDKHGSPTLKGKYSSPNQRDRLLEVMQNIAQSAGVALADGMDLELLQAASTGTDVYSPFCGYCDTQAVEAILLQNLTTNITGGSYAASETHLSIREELVDMDCSLLSDGPYADLSKWITEFNYPDAEPPLIYRPRVKVADEARARRDTAIVGLTGKTLSKSYLATHYDIEFASSEEIESDRIEAEKYAPKEADPNAEQPFVFSETIDFKNRTVPAKKQKNCTKGIPCKGQCISAKKTCKTEVTGEAAKAADYLDAKVPLGKAKAEPKTFSSQSGTTPEERKQFMKARPEYKMTAAEAKKLTKKVPGAPPPHAEEILALEMYTGVNYSAINAALRGNDKTALKTPLTVEQKEKFLETAKFADSCLSALPDYKGTVYRGTNLPQKVIDSYVVGNVLTEKGFTSSSTKPSVAEGFNNPLFIPDGDRAVSYRIKSKKGKSIKSLSAVEQEEEVLFRPETKFKVLGNKTKKGVVHIYLEEVD